MSSDMEDDQKPDMGDEELLEDIDTENGEDLSAEELKAKLAKQQELLKEAIQTKKNWRTKYEELSKSVPKETLSSTPAPAKVDEKDEVVARISKLETVEAKRQFGYAHGLSPEETDYAFAFAKGMDKSPDDILKDTFFQKGLDARRAEETQSNATPRPSSRLSKVEGKTFEEMKPEERAKHWSKMTGAKS